MYLFFGSADSPLLLRFFSSCGEQGLLSGCNEWASRCSDFSCGKAQALGRELQQPWHVGSAVAARRFQSTDSRVVVHGHCCSMACGIFLDLGSNLHLLHWQADSLSLSHLGSLICIFLIISSAVNHILNIFCLFFQRCFFFLLLLICESCLLIKKTNALLYLLQKYLPSFLFNL